MLNRTVKYCSIICASFGLGCADDLAAFSAKYIHSAIELNVFNSGQSVCFLPYSGVVEYVADSNATVVSNYLVCDGSFPFNAFTPPIIKCLSKTENILDTIPIDPSKLKKSNFIELLVFSKNKQFSNYDDYCRAIKNARKQKIHILPSSI